MFKNFKNYKMNSGMTLVELMVVLAIFMIVTGLTIFDYRGFKSRLTTQNLADDIALSIRKAQSYAIGTRGAGGSFDYGYGIHFSLANPVPGSTAGNKKSFVIFRNSTNTNLNKYDVGSGECGTPDTECVEILNINTLDEIKGFYIGSNFEPYGVKLDITFKRPNPDADFCFKKTTYQGDCYFESVNNYSIIVGPTGQTTNNKLIKVTNTGQISIENSSLNI